MLSGNKGEWSEVYVFLKLLADGRIYAADSDLNKLDDIYFPIVKIIRENMSEGANEYITGEVIDIYVNDEKVKTIEKNKFEEQSRVLIAEIRESKGSAFSLPNIQTFMDEIFCYSISAPAKDKSDITMQILDVNTGYSPIVGFSIKSELGSSPTLLNAGKTTNFIYKIVHNNPLLVKEVNEIYKVSKGKKHTDVRGRIKRIIEDNGQLEYIGMQNQTFSDNLVLIDSSMGYIIAETILYFYRDGISSCIDLVEKLELGNPMNYGNVNAYRYKFKKFLTAIALGMKPATIWDGVDEASGGYIIVTKKGDVLAYHIYNRNYFEEYLLKNTKYETASTSRHEFGKVYSGDGEDFIKLNLQIRFK